jgi:hypothetical protein
MPSTPLKNWLKNLSNECIYGKQNPNRTRDIWLQSWPFRSQRKQTFSPKFWLWKPAPKKCRVTRGFMFWFFLSWGIDYRKKVQKPNPKKWVAQFFSSISLYHLLLGRAKVKGFQILNKKLKISGPKNSPPKFQPSIRSKSARTKIRALIAWCKIDGMSSKID